MGIDVLKGRGVRVEVATVFSAAKVVTAISKGTTASVTSAAHGLLAGAVGYFDTVVGMPELDGMAATAANVTTGAFDLLDVDSTNFGTFTSGNFIPVQTWSTLVNATKVDIAGGDASKQDVTVLLDNQKQEENGMLSAQTVSIDVLIERLTNAAAQFVRRQARSGGFVLFRVTYPSGARRIWRGQPSLPGESTGVDAVVSGSMASTVRGYVVMTDV